MKKTLILTLALSLIFSFGMKAQTQEINKKKDEVKTEVKKTTEKVKDAANQGVSKALNYQQKEVSIRIRKIKENSAMHIHLPIHTRRPQ